VRARCCGERCSGCREWRLDELLEQRWPGKVGRGLALELARRSETKHGERGA